MVGIEMRQIKVYAGYNMNLDVRLSSSSGAIFSLLAENVLSQNGVVYGVKMSNNCYSAEFTRVVDATNLLRLQGSKYLQAKMGDAYKQVKEDLFAGKFVLFSGTGCQVNGLKNFLGKDYDNLLCVDVVCHGAPSPALWRKYAEYQEKNNGGKLKSISFRCKDDSWNDFGMKELLTSATSQNKEKQLYISKDKDSYMQMFLRDYCLRPSCYECIAKKVKMSDLTIADFWGINEVAPEMNDGMGTSLIIVRTEKGMKMLRAICGELILKEVTYEDGVRNNPAEYKSCSRPPQRDTFFNDMTNMNFEELEKKYAYPIKVSLKTSVKRIIKSIIKTIFRTAGGAA